MLERNPGEKAQWFRQAHDWIAAHPAIAAVVYFNADNTTNGVSYDWHVDTSPASFEGFRYLYSGPAPVPPSPSETPPATTPTPDPDTVVPADVPAPVTTPKPTRTRPGTTPAGVADAAASPAAGGANRAPSPRLTWVLQLLRQLDAASVAT